MRIRILAILGFLFFGGLAPLIFKWWRQAYREEQDDKILDHPAIGVAMVFVLCVIGCILCLIYSLGLWDVIGNWLGLNAPEVPVGRQF